MRRRTTSAQMASTGTRDVSCPRMEDGRPRKRPTAAPGDVVLFRGSDSFSDATLTPHASGAQRSPIVFGSYGGSRARLHHAGAAVWFKGVEHVTFRDLDLTNDGTDGAVIAGSPSGGSGFISIERCRSTIRLGSAFFSPTSADHSWLIADNAISLIGDSGLVILGSGDAIRHNVIADTGLNSAITLGQARDLREGRRAVIVGNTITNFQANAFRCGRATRSSQRTPFAEGRSASLTSTSSRRAGPATFSGTAFLACARPSTSRVTRTPSQTRIRWRTLSFGETHSLQGRVPRSM